MPKPKFKASQARKVAEGILEQLAPLCLPGRAAVAGSLRRGKEWVGDAEILIQPIPGAAIANLFGEPAGRAESDAERLIARWIAERRLTLRRGKDGSVACGEKNKLLLHPASGIPVDIFAETTGEETAWWSLLVCRTGGAETNIRLAQGAQRALRRWDPYRGVLGYPKRDILPARSEQDIFAQCGIPYLEPEQR